MTTGETDLSRLIHNMSPRLNPGHYVFTRVDSEVPEGADPIVTVREVEGLTLILVKEQADALSLSYDYVAAWITLEVHSSLEAIGLTAEVSRALTGEGISANVVAGFAHDHVFVPVERADDALRTLTELATL